MLLLEDNLETKIIAKEIYICLYLYLHLFMPWPCSKKEFEVAYRAINT